MPILKGSKGSAYFTAAEKGKMSMNFKITPVPNMPGTFDVRLYDAEDQEIEQTTCFEADIEDVKRSLREKYLKEHSSLEFHELQVPGLPENTVNLVLIDINGIEIKSILCPKEEVEDQKQAMRREYFSVSDLIKEIKNLEYDISLYGHVTDEERHERIVFNCSFKRGNYSFETEYSVGTYNGEPSHDLVLEVLLDDAYSVLPYANGPDDEEGFIKWADDLDFPSSGTKGLVRAQKAWKTTWEIKEHLWTLFSSTELENIKHAFEEGRRR